MCSSDLYEVVWITAAMPEEVESYKERYLFLDEVYFGDELEIKTIVRYNPGLIWLDDGLVVGKWSAIDFNKVWERM